MKRGEVWWVSFKPEVGVQIRKQRPAVIVSNDASNKHLHRVQVIPLTSQITKLYPSEALVTFAGKKGKAMADQLTTVSKLRLVNYAEKLKSVEMRQVEQAIKVQLGLN
ncbi:type II toxin-antitoxin system PemK/MazF family toxin [Chloroflexota bacterium]